MRLNFGIDFMDYPQIVGLLSHNHYFQNLGYIYYADVLITDGRGGMQKGSILDEKAVHNSQEGNWVDRDLKRWSQRANLWGFVKLKECMTPRPIQWDDQLYGEGNNFASTLSIY